MHSAGLLLLWVVAALASDLALLPVKPRDKDDAVARLEDLTEPSPRTLETLQRLDLEGYRSDPAGAITKLKVFAKRAVDADLVYALAELSWIEGRRLDRRRRAGALDRYVDSVAYSYDVLFDPEAADGRNPADPRFRWAIDLYNAGLEKLLRAGQASGDVRPGGTMPLQLHDGQLEVRVDLPNSPWNPDDVDELIVASDYRVEGLVNRIRRFGLGVPLIAVRRAEDHPNSAGPADFLAGDTAFPLTAFLRPQSRLRDQPVEGEPDRAVTLDLIDTVRSQTLRDRPDLMLEADLSVPIAYMFARTDLERVRWAGLFKPEQAAGRSGLILIRPYEPDKIPVVMVHGLLSSPLCWVPMLNELLRDPQITSRYQFLLYLYPTGVSIPIAASGLRAELQDLHDRVDPEGTSPTFNRMVLLGHSMGGLLSHSMAVSSGDRYWFQLSDRPFDDIIGAPDTLNRLRRYLYFEPLPFVERVVFMATPHRGSDMSRGVVGRLGSNLIEQPDEIADLFRSLVRENPDAFDPKQFRRLPNSIDTLEPRSPVLAALMEMSPRPGVAFHSIIGNDRPGPRETGTDGIVPYSSAFFPGANSTRVVRSDHAVQKDPEAILEVHRILYEHASLTPRGSLAAGAGVIPPPRDPALSPATSIQP